MKRPIKSHKGGRTERLDVRLEPEIKTWLQSKGAADWITAKVREEQQADYAETAEEQKR